MSNVSKRRREGSRPKIKSMGDHKEFLRRITRTLYYGQLPVLPCLSLPVTEVSCSLWSVSQRGRSLRRLHADAAASIARQACVSPCALVLAVLYLERLNACNPDYLASTAPTDLFLVSLMVGNKFLQDDGEDEEVICSEWAASGGLQLKQLKKLEVDFLNAIDWNVFVNEKSFESGLVWLEREVALRQAQLRGFFTYGDLTASVAGGLAPDTLRALAGAVAALALGYVAALTACLASALVLSHAWLPTIQYMAVRHSQAPAVHTNITATPVPNVRPDTLQFSNNATEDPSTLDALLAEESATAATLKCCTKWTQYQDSVDSKRNLYDTVVVYDWKSFEPWWSKTSVLNWLYQSSLVNPLQRWLEKINEYGEWATRDLPALDTSGRIEQCQDYVKPDMQHQCLRQWLNLSKLSALVASVSDR